MSDNVWALPLQPQVPLSAFNKLGGKAVLGKKNTGLKYLTYLECLFWLAKLLYSPKGGHLTSEITTILSGCRISSNADLLIDPSET